jgi:DNA-binding IclR family transcriptional regulator
MLLEGKTVLITGVSDAISVSSAAQYMSDERMDALSIEVGDTARAISHDLGWVPKT